jgi:hypothetical protein
MILYYDNYIDDKPLLFHSVKTNQSIRRKDSQYKMPRKLDIAKYTLASYKIISWSKVIIKFDVVDEEDRELFIKYAKELFPDAEIIPHRSDNQKAYRETVEQICKLDDEWIFYTPNNDHPIIASDISHLYKLLEKAIEFKKKYKFVSIIYSMFSEYCNYNEYNKYWKYTKIIDNDDIAISFVKYNGDNNSLQIVHRDLLKYWFCSRDLGNVRIIRAEDVEKFFRTPNQLIIAPKKEICAHFDGYSHLKGHVTQITADQIPPLFIPNGFFDNSIRIAYGYPDYREGWVNINPSAKYFSFRSKKNGTDLKIGLQDIPLFWKDRIKDIDINPFADLNKLNRKRDEYFEVLYNPWKSLNNRIYLTVYSFLYMSIYLPSIRYIRLVINNDDSKSVST